MVDSGQRAHHQLQPHRSGAVPRAVYPPRPGGVGDFETRHRFFSDNRKLLAEVEALEHKSRRRDILVDDEDLFRFYDARLPEDVISAATSTSGGRRRKSRIPSCSTSRKRC